ncbi:MAG: solute:sodium symporter family transporter [Gammaproteobacteria bacterium]|nr:MAG: solute:sodium symporter family transporter [Gammaproteobacteria bacterium]
MYACRDQLRNKAREEEANVFAVISFVGFTAMVAVAAYYFTKEEKLDTSDGYFLGGRSLTGPVICGSLMLTNLSTEHLVGMNGGAYREGAILMLWETLAALAAIVMALYFLPRYLRMGFTTIPEYLNDRYDKTTRSITALLFLMSYVFALLPVVLYTGSLALEGLFNVSETLSLSKSASVYVMVWSIGTLGSIYAIFGGLRAVAISDTINGVGLLIGGLLIPFFGLMHIGDGNLVDGFNLLWTEYPEKFVVLGDAESSIPWQTLFTGMFIAQGYYWIANQAIIQRALGAKNLAEGQKGVLMTGGVKLLGPIMLVLPGIIAWHIFEGGLENPDTAYPQLVATVLPPVLTGFFAAVVMGAVLSTFNSALNSASTLFSIDIYKGWLRPNASDHDMVRFGKIVGVVLAVGAMIVAPMMANAPDGLYLLLQALAGVFNVPIFSILMVGLMTRRVPALAAKVVIVVEPIIYVLLTFVLKVDIHFLHLMGTMFAGSVLTMLLIGQLFPRDSDFVARDSNEVDTTPWALAKPVSLVIALISLSFFVIFAGN